MTTTRQLEFELWPLKPQTRQVLRYLEGGESLTAIEAIEQLRCARLAARVDELRDAGYVVVSTLVQEGGKRFARYRLGG